MAIRTIKKKIKLTDFEKHKKLMNMGPLWEIRVYYGPVEEDEYHYFDTD